MTENDEGTIRSVLSSVESINSDSKRRVKELTRNIAFCAVFTVIVLIAIVWFTISRQIVFVILNAPAAILIGCAIDKNREARNRFKLVANETDKTITRLKTALAETR